MNQNVFVENVSSRDGVSNHFDPVISGERFTSPGVDRKFPLSRLLCTRFPSEILFSISESYRLCEILVDD